MAPFTLKSHPDRTRALPAMLASVLLVGCAALPPLPTAPPAAPVPDSPQAVLSLLEWALENRNHDAYTALFSDDFVFQFSQTDSAGNAFRNRPWQRPDESISALHMLTGGSSTEPPADRIALEYTSALIDLPDSRTGKHAAWHRQIRVEVALRVTRGQSAFEVRGPGLFFFVRGDSAAIPQELRDLGVGPDPGRWWIERWEDETASGEAAPGFAPLPSSSVSWGSIKALYR